jgi:hypothetical protein
VTRDYYAESRALGADLRETGHKAWADKIDTVIETGSTSSEILMGLRWTLGELCAKEHSLSPDIKQRAGSLQTGIDSALS